MYESATPSRPNNTSMGLKALWVKQEIELGNITTQTPTSMLSKLELGAGRLAVHCNNCTEQNY